jgi:hypothetical protein
MIVTLLVGMILGLVMLIFSPIHLPEIDNSILGDLQTLIGYISASAYNLVRFILPNGTVSSLFTVLLVVIAARHIYSFVLWVWHKLPFSSD